MKPSFLTRLNALDSHDWQNPWCVAGFHQELWTRSQRSYSERAIDKMPQRLCFRSNLSPAAEAAISSHFSTMPWDDVGGLHAVMWNSRRDVSQVEPYRVLQDLTSVSGVIQHGFLCIAWGQHVQVWQCKERTRMPLFLNMNSQNPSGSNYRLRTVPFAKTPQSKVWTFERYLTQCRDFTSS